MYRYRNYNFNPTYRNVKQPYLNSHKPPTVSNPGKPMPPPLPPPPVCHKPPPPPPKPPAPPKPPKHLPKKKNKFDIICFKKDACKSLHDVEHFLCNFNYFIKYIKLYNLLK